MEVSWCLLSKHKSSSLLIIVMMILLFFMVGWIQGLSIEEDNQRRALVEIKASLHEISKSLNVYDILPTWVDDGGKYCDWERIKCDPTTSTYVTELSLRNIFSMDDQDDYYYNYRAMDPLERKNWPLNASLFLHFKELKSLDLSLSHIGNTFVSTGLKKLSSLKKLEMLNLSSNYIETNIFSSLSGLTSLKILDLSYINGYGYISSYIYDISEFPALENLEILLLQYCGFHGTLEMQGTTNLSSNRFNKSLITSLRSLTSLKTLDLRNNGLTGSFPSQALSHFSNLERLDLSFNHFFDDTPSTEDCKSLMKLKKLVSVSLASNNFNKSIISCLSFLPSLNNLDLSYFYNLGSSLSVQELSSLRELKTLDLSNCDFESFSLDELPNSHGLEVLLLRGNSFNGTLPMKALSSLRELKTLDLSYCGFESFPTNELPYSHGLEVLLLSNNNFQGTLPMKALSSLRELKTLDLSECGFESFPTNELPHSHGLEVLLLRDNNFNGTLPMKVLTHFHHLEVLDLSFNDFFGSIPSTIKSLSSLKFVSFAYNHLNGSLSDSGLCDLKNLHELHFSDNMFDGELPECLNMLSSLKVFDISSNRFTGIVMSSLIENLKSLEYIDFSHNKFEGSFSFSSFSTHKKLQVVAFISDNDKFVVNTEEPIGWTPMFELKVLVLSNCKLNGPKGGVIPGFLLHQHELRKLDLSHNSLQGQFPNWLINNNTMLEILTLRSNSFGGNFCLELYRNHKTRVLDISGNHMNGTIPGDIEKFLPSIAYLNLSRNSLHGVIPPSFGDLIKLEYLDLSHNELSGEVPTGLFSNPPNLKIVKLSNNNFHGEVLSGNVTWSKIERLLLDSNSFTGEIGSEMSIYAEIILLDISNNFFTGVVPSWISNMSYNSLTFVSRNNSLGGQFPCGTTSFDFLDISENNFSGPIPSCLNFQSLEHLHLGSNRFTGSIPISFSNLTEVLTLDVGNNLLSGKIPKFLGELSTLRIILLGRNKFSGSIPKELCKLTNANLIDLSSNFISGSIPSCLQNITRPSDQAFMQYTYFPFPVFDFENFHISLLDGTRIMDYTEDRARIQDEVMFTTKSSSRTYKGEVLDIMFGLDLSCNKLTGDIPEELGLLTQIHVLNLSHNWLSGRIPVKFSNLINIESLDLSSNRLTGNVPSELVNLKSLSTFNVSFNNLSGRLPDMKAQFSTFTKESYEGNPLLCGLPLENECTNESNVTRPLYKDETDDKWYHVDMTSFYGSSGATWIVTILGFAAIVYINPYWRRRWLDLVEECMYTCYYFLLDSSRKLFNYVV